MDINISLFVPIIIVLRYWQVMHRSANFINKEIMENAVLQ